MRVIHLTTTEPAEWLAKQRERPTYLDHRHFDPDLVIGGGEPVRVIEPNGKTLLVFKPGALDPFLCKQVRPILRKAAMKGGDLRPYVKGGIVGYYDQPQCRMSKFTAEDFERWIKLLPFIRGVNHVFKKSVADRYIAQRTLALRSNPRYVIGGTAFTTVTVNIWNAKYTARTPVHMDNGDYRKGFGVISVLRTGQYTGGELIFPKFRVAADLHTGDVLLCDVHQLHCNNEITPISAGWERLATVSYFRTKIRNCPK